MNINLQEALQNGIWQQHKIGDEYFLINKGGGKDAGWKIAYYPIMEDGKTGEVYKEPRALIEKPMKDGIDFREMPLRFLVKHE